MKRRGATRYGSPSTNRGALRTTGRSISWVRTGGQQLTIGAPISRRSGPTTAMRTTATTTQARTGASSGVVRADHPSAGAAWCGHLVERLADLVRKYELIGRQRRA